MACKLKAVVKCQGPNPSPVWHEHVNYCGSDLVCSLAGDLPRESEFTPAFDQRHEHSLLVLADDCVTFPMPDNRSGFYARATLLNAHTADYMAS